MKEGKFLLPISLNSVVFFKKNHGISYKQISQFSSVSNCKCNIKLSKALIWKCNLRNSVYYAIWNLHDTRTFHYVKGKTRHVGVLFFGIFFFSPKVRNFVSHINSYFSKWQSYDMSSCVMQIFLEKKVSGIGVARVLWRYQR